MRISRTLIGICLVAGTVISATPPAVAAPPSGPTGQQQSQNKVFGDSSLAEATGQAPETPSSVEPATDRLVVKFKESTPAETKSQVLQKADAAAPSDESKVLKSTTNDSDVVQTSEKLDNAEQAEVVKQLEADPSVEYAEADKIVKNATAAYPTTPNDSLYSSRQWNMRTINASGAWQYATGAGQTIGVVDTGITNHPDLNSKVTGGHDFVSPDYDRDGTPGRDSDPTDPGVLNPSENWHGTHVAGIAAASTNNGIGVAGVAPDAAIEPVRAFGIGASGYVSDFADAITWASGGQVAGAPVNPRPSTVINFSAAWNDQCSATIKSAIDGAYSRNVPVVVAAGNAGVNANDVTPANCLGAMVVGASASSDVMTGYSNYGPMLDVLAPGGTTGADVYSTYNTGYESPAQANYGPLNGTSMAAPHVAGVIALMKQRNPNISIEQIRNILVSTGANVNGYSRIDARAAVAAVAPVDNGPVVVNGIKNLYDSQGGASKFGTPRNNESGGLVNGGVFQEFSKNYTIYWTPFTGTHSVNFSGAIGAKFKAAGYENAYGYPSSEEISGNGYAYQWFKTASGRSTLMMWTPQTGANAIVENNAIGQKWIANGRERGAGFPSSDEFSANGYAYQWFKTASGRSTLMMWTPQTGANAIVENNAIGQKWIADGREQGSGFPVGDEVTSAQNNFAYQTFKRGAVVKLYMWTPSSGAHTVIESGAIGNAWTQNGRESGWGVPTTDEFRGSDAKVHQKFSKGVEVTWTASEGIRVLR
ncbi:S8 family serine peptidase [Rothia uropygioeca]|uniref:S8 family serine peptidase n=1 Tax=Kocuria sp. 257 TaxID=2021970 RepID=UPI001012E887|nr:S8 family serine peptidase [Kocuria sp. 257]